MRGRLVKMFIGQKLLKLPKMATRILTSLFPYMNEGKQEGFEIVVCVCVCLRVSAYWCVVSFSTSK